MNSKKTMLPIVTVAVLGSFLFINTSAAHAQTTNANPLQGLVQMVAQKFGLDQNQVQNVVNDYKTQQHQNMQKTMQQRQKTRLDNLVKQGKITQAQEDAILQELTSLQSKYNPGNFKNLTPKERKQQMQAMVNELKTWAKSQNIPLQYVVPGVGMRTRVGWMMRTKPSPTPTQ